MFKRILTTLTALVLSSSVYAEAVNANQLQQGAVTPTPQTIPTPALDINRIHDYLISTFGKNQTSDIEKTIFNKRLAGTVTCTGSGPSTTYGGVYTYTGIPHKVSLIFITFDGNFARTYLDNQSTCFYAFDAKMQ